MKRTSLLSAVMRPMLLLALLQVLSLGVLLVLSGGFDNVKQYAYNQVIEKTENRKSYLETALNQKTNIVYETALKVSERANTLLDGRDSSAFQQDKTLCRRLLDESVEDLISLIRRDMVNDAFLILDTGTLYDAGGRSLRSGIYLRDTDIKENSLTGNEDIFMEMGPSELARAHGLPLDFAWSLHLDTTQEENFDFLTAPLAADSSGKPLYQLGYWSNLSAISPSQLSSVKYVLPLVLEDGTVCGVLGIGLLEKTIGQSLPSGDFMFDSACYILAADLNGSGRYQPVLHQGAAYSRLVREDTVFDLTREEAYHLYGFTASNGPASLGSVQTLNLYGSGSPYRSQKWALISVTDKAALLSAYYGLLRVFTISAVFALAVSLFFSLFISRKISQPVRQMVNQLDERRGSHDAMVFQSSRITEIDRLADSICSLQADLTEYAYRVSRIITASGSKLGVFLYDRYGSVFVGESLAKLLGFDCFHGKDETISTQEFRKQLHRIDPEEKIFSLPIFGPEYRPDWSMTEELACQTSDGSQVFYKFSLTRDKDTVLGIVQDITDTTAKLQESNAALRLACEAAEKANSTKSDFLSRMSHDIRTPMNAILNLTTIARNHIGNREKLEDCFQKLAASGQYLLSLINEVLDMSKIEAGKLELAEEKVDLLQLTDSLLELIRPTVRDKGHTLTVEREGIEHTHVIGDSLRLQQIFMNILSNAVKYTPPGGELLFRMTEKPVTRDNIGCFDFVFRDNGKGMSEEFQKKLFTPFEREEDVRVAKEQGTGLGMTIAYSIIKMLGGDIKVKSKLNVGTTFTITLYLPLDTDTHESGAIHSEGQEADVLELLREGDYTGCRVLLVEDNDLNAEIATEILEMMNLTVERAENGLAAVQRFTESPQGWYDLIFMDIQMPVMNGYESTSSIRRSTHPDATRIPIVAMTANAFAEDVRDAENAGMNAHIAKPLEIEKLRDVLGHWLKK